MAAKDFVSFERLQLFLTKVKELISEKADKQQITTSSLLASGWSSGLYSFESTYPVASYDLEVAPDSTCTVAQLDEYNAAQIVGSATSNVLTAKGDAPTSDIPIILKVVKK